MKTKHVLFIFIIAMIILSSFYFFNKKQDISSYNKYHYDQMQSSSTYGNNKPNASSMPPDVDASSDVSSKDKLTSNDNTQRYIRYILEHKMSKKLYKQINSKKIPLISLRQVILNRLTKDTITTCLNSNHPDVYLLLLNIYTQLNNRELELLILRSLENNYNLFSKEKYEKKLIDTLNDCIKRDFFQTDYENSLIFDILGKFKSKTTTDLLLKGMYNQKGIRTQEIIIENIGYRLQDNYNLENIRNALYFVISSSSSPSLIEKAMEMMQYDDSPDQYIPLIINKLSDDNSIIREKAIDVILDIKSDFDFLPYLESQMYIETAEPVRTKIVSAISYIADKQDAIDLYFNFLDSNINTGTKVEIISRLRQFNNDISVKNKLFNILKNSADYSLRSTATETLRDFEISESDVSSLLNVLENEQNELVASDIIETIRSYTFDKEINAVQMNKLIYIYDNSSSDSIKTAIKDLINNK